MKRYVPWFILVLVAAWLMLNWRIPKRQLNDFDFRKFGEIPMLENGRLKPIDTVARNALLIIRGRQNLRLDNGKTLSATQWFTDVIFNEVEANKHPVFCIQNPEVLGLFGWTQYNRKFFSHQELEPYFWKIEEQALLAERIESARRSPYETAICNLRNALLVYQELRRNLQPGAARDLWGGGVSPIGVVYTTMGEAYRTNHAEVFNYEANTLASLMMRLDPMAASKASKETLFNHIAPFYRCLELYLFAFLLICGSWLVEGWTKYLNRSALFILLLALTLHTCGLAARMALQGRPPVTNLYSSAVFIGWGTVFMGLIAERFLRNGIGLACSSMVGFATLVIAHHLSATGDTLEMLQAVLNTNFWLTTHVVTITLGYSAMFLAGMLAMFYIVRGVFTRSLAPEAALALARMTYGILCFAALFSFIGTILGGIWADQCWGRFWGWDPKENGALLIVLWCAIILHAKRDGYIQQRGLMVMALFGNVVTSFSWFGVNMLGVGLHSYGFMEKALPWLIGFIGSQLALMVLAAIPVKRWRSSPENHR